jgi:hypothetical protein
MTPEFEERQLLPIRVLHDFVDRIEPLAIDYMLSGSTAMMHYSVYRFTADLDIVVDMSDTDQRRFTTAFEPHYYVPRDAMSRAIATTRMFNIIHIKTAYKVDCVIKKKTAFQKLAFQRKENAPFFGKNVSIIQKDDLILSKLDWAKESRSEMQFRDVKNLLQSGFDAAYVSEWADKLGVAELLDSCLEENENE